MKVSNSQNTADIINELNITNNQLDSIIEKHPYFQLGLLGKSIILKRENHIESLKTIRKCAILFPDRTLLHSYLNKTNIESDTTQAEGEEVVPEENIAEENIAIDTTTNAIAEENPSISLIDTEKDIEDHSKKENIKKDGLEKEFLVEAINQSIQKDALAYKLEENVETEIPPPPLAKKVLSFSEWIDESSNLDESLNKIELIDKFIQESPQIKRLNDTSFYSPIEKGKKSISADSLVYTETLADIFLQQGNKSHAIKAYQYLMLKNPQKSVYFADLIKKLEEIN
jgi:hypothetical protein